MMTVLAVRTCTKVSFTNGLGQGSEAPLTQTRSCFSVPVVLKSISCGKFQPDRDGGQPSSDSDTQNPRSTFGRHDDHELVKLIFVQVLRLALLCSVLCVFDRPAPLSAQTPSSALLSREASRIDVIRRIAPSVVCVMAPDGQGGGSGVLISADGFAVSNFHVTSGSGPFLKCGLNDGRIYDAVITGIDPTGDIALIRLLGRTDFPFATPGDSDQVQAGQEVLALGNPFLLASDFTPTVTWGIVSGVHRYQYPAGTFLEYTDCIQIDASINPGNSGGPLFDIDGKWIGINGRASFEKRGRVNAGAAYAISVRQVLLFLEHLKCGLIVDHGIADFTVETSSDGRPLISQVSEISEAWRRGLRPQDELLTFADRAIGSANDFQNILGIFPEGTRVPLSWRNADGIQSATIRLRPLHAFQKAPELPGERRPQGLPPDQQPDQPPQPDVADPEVPGPEVPEELKALFEERDSFANFYFNKQRVDQILKDLHAATTPASAPVPSWVMTLTESAAAAEPPMPLTGELVIGEAGAGFSAGGQDWYQPANEPAAGNEAPRLHGLLVAALQWHRLLTRPRSAFDEIVAQGSGHSSAIPSAVSCPAHPRGNPDITLVF
jgi:serine protease Do